MRVRKCLASALMALTLAALAGCGGGGGGGNDGGSSGGATPSGLVPAAPTLGATLYDNASALRPVAAGATWVYRSHDYETAQIIEMTTSAIAGTGTSVVETDSDDPASPTTVSVDDSGSVRITSSLALTDDLTVETAGYELRSPVRQNDQYVLLDKTIRDIGGDLDGDGKADGIRMAVYSRVVGNENISVPNHSAAVVALRVDTSFVLQAVFSSGGVSDVATTTRTAWYLPGVGLAREVVRSGDASGTLLSESLLLGHEHGTSGWGYTVKASPHSLTGSQALLTGPSQILARDDGAILLAGGALHRVDRNGQVLASRTMPAYDAEPALYLTSAGIRAIPGSPLTAMRVDAYSSDGEFQSVLGTQDLTSGAASYAWGTPAMASHRDSALLWTAVSRTTDFPAQGESPAVIAVRRIGSDGLAIGTDALLTASSNVVAASVRVAVSASSAVIMWCEAVDLTRFVIQVRRIQNDGSLLWSQALTVPRNEFASVVATVWADNDASWIGWLGTDSATSQGAALGVRLDASGQLLGVTNTTDALGLQSVAVSTDTYSAWLWSYQVRDRAFYGAGYGYGQLYADSTTSGSWITVAAYQGSDTQALAASLQQQMLYRIPDLSLPSGASAGKVVAFSDRILLLAVDPASSALKPVVIWR